MNLWAAQSKMNDRAAEYTWGKNYIIGIHMDNVFMNCHYLSQLIPTISETILQFYQYVVVKFREMVESWKDITKMSQSFFDLQF